MGKRKLAERKQEVEIEEEESLVTESGGEDQGEAGSGLSEGGEREAAEEEELHGDVSSAEEVDEFHEGLSSAGEDDATSGSEASIAEEDQEDTEQVSSTALGRAFAKIMKKRLPESELTEVMGPVLVERQKLIVKSHEEEEKIETKPKKHSKDDNCKGHVLPQTYTDPKEKALIKLATKGVVRLFNAVTKAQKVQADKDISSRKDGKVTLKQSKAAFNAELRAGGKLGTKQAGGISEIPEDEQKDPEPGWAALKSDFLLGNSKIVDWDKHLDDAF